MGRRWYRPLAMPPLALLLVLIGWASTSLVMVRAHERGVHERFGELAGEPLLDPVDRRRGY